MLPLCIFIMPSAYYFAISGCPLVILSSNEVPVLLDATRLNHRGINPDRYQFNMQTIRWFLDCKFLFMVPITTHLSNVYSHIGHIHVLFIVLFSHPRSQALNGASHVKLDSAAF